MSGPRCVCWFCGAEIPGWWSGDAPRPLFDAGADDEAHERWLDTPCPRCGKTPREGEPRASMPGR